MKWTPRSTLVTATEFYSRLLQACLSRHSREQEELLLFVRQQHPAAGVVVFSNFHERDRHCCAIRASFFHQCIGHACSNLALLLECAAFEKSDLNQRHVIAFGSRPLPSGTPLCIAGSC